MEGKEEEIASQPGWNTADQDGYDTLSDGQRIQLVRTPGCPCKFCNPPGGQEHPDNA